MNLSIIIPVLNEAESLPRLLKVLERRTTFPGRTELIICDGGSIDGTVEIIKNITNNYSFKSVTLVETKSGRGLQIHSGAQQSTNDILYFLHVDSHPPKSFDSLIVKAIKENNEAGCFRMKFRSNHILLCFTGWLTRFSWRASRGGDQSLFITRALYNKLGGFRTDMPFYEDYDMIHRLYDNGTFKVLPYWLSTSARRYRQVGTWKLQFFYLSIYYKKWRGATIDELYVYYKKWCSKQETNSKNNQKSSFSKKAI